MRGGETTCWTGKNVAERDVVNPSSNGEKEKNNKVDEKKELLPLYCRNIARAIFGLALGAKASSERFVRVQMKAEGPLSFRLTLAQLEKRERERK